MVEVEGKNGIFSDREQLYLAIINIAIGIGVIIFIVLDLYQSFFLHF